MQTSGGWLLVRHYYIYTDIHTYIPRYIHIYIHVRGAGREGSYLGAVAAYVWQHEYLQRKKRSPARLFKVPT